MGGIEWYLEFSDPEEEAKFLWIIGEYKNRRGLLATFLIVWIWILSGHVDPPKKLSSSLYPDILLKM